MFDKSEQKLVNGAVQIFCHLGELFFVFFLALDFELQRVQDGEGIKKEGNIYRIQLKCLNQFMHVLFLFLFLFLFLL